MADTLEGDLITAKSAWEGFQLSIMNGSSNISKWLREGTQLWTFILNRWSDDLKSTEDAATDIFTNVTKTAKKETKKFNKDFGEGATTFSRQLYEEVNSLQQGLGTLERLAAKSKKKIADLTKDGLVQGRSGLMQINSGAIAEEEKVHAERLQRLEATKKAIIDLTDEIEVQKKKEGTAIESADLKQFQSDQQKIRNKQKATAKTKRDKEKAEKEALAKEKEDYKESQEAFKIALEEELNADKQNLIDKTITQEEYDLRAFEAEQAHLENMKNLNIAYGEDAAAINGQILDNELQMIASKVAAEKIAFDKKVAEDAKEKTDRVAKIDEMQEIGNQLIYIAGEEESLQEVKKAGIAISRAAAIAKSFEAMADYGKAISSAAAESPWWMKIINVVGLIAAMASTLSLIKSMKSSFGEGGMIEEFANGGLVQGKSHAQGGEKFAVGGRVVELEGGEAVMNKRSTSMFSSQLSAMNAAGGGVKFADGGLLNQPSFSQQQFNALGQNQMMGAMGGTSKVVVVEADITSSQEAVSVIQAQATV